MAETAKKTTVKAKPKASRTHIEINTFDIIDKPMPLNLGKGTKYAFLTTMHVGDCVCLPTGSFTAPEDVLKRAIMGAAKRNKVKVVCAMQPEGFCIWRKE